MVKKLKTKFFKLKPSFFISIAFLILGGLFLFLPNSAKATAIQAKDVKFELTVGDNFYRVDQKGSINIPVKLKLISPSQIVLGRAGQPIRDSLTRGGASDAINGFFVGVVEKTQNDTICKNISSLFGNLVGSSIYNCSFDVKTGLKPDFATAITLKQGDELSYTLSLDTSAREKLGINSATNEGLVHEVYVYPTFELAGIGTNTSFSPAKSVFLQVYPDTAILNQHISDPRPQGVPANGSLVTTPNQTPGNSLAGSVASIINEIIGVLIGFVQELVYGLFYWLIAPLIQAMLSIHVYTDTFVAVIYPGWEVIRNICNIFFIVALMVIALATLFRVDSYQTRPLLIQLILAALMINFSLVIAQAILALADTIQAQFLPANVTVIRSLAGDLMVGTYRDLYGTKAFADASFAGIIKPLFFLAMSLGSFMVFAAIAVFLVIRIVALWLLLLISPIAYACGVLPSTAQYRKTWWDAFLKYAFFTPIMAFFLNLTAVISNQFRDIPILQTVADKSLVNDLGNSDLAGFVFKVASNLLLLVFLFAALQVADKAGIYGASGITKIAEKGIFAPFGVAGMGAAAGFGAVGRAYTRYTTKKLEAADKSGKTKTANMWRTAQFLNLKVASEAYKQRMHEKEEEAYEPAIGYVRDSISRIIPTEWSKDHGKIRLGQKTYYGRIAQAAMINKKRSLWEKIPLSEEEKVQAFLDAHHYEDVEALSYVIQEGRHEDGVMIEYMNRNKPKYIKKLAESYFKKEEDKFGNAVTSKADAQAKAERDFESYYDAVEFSDLLVDKLKHSGLNAAQIGEKLSHLQEHAEGENKERGLGYAVWDDEFKRFYAISDLNQYAEHEKAGDMLEELAKTEVFDEIRDASGNITALRFYVQDDVGNNTTEFKDITSFASLKSAMDELGEKYGSPYDHGRQADLKYELMGARKNMDAQKRKERGNSERWAGSIEPAADTIQYESGFDQFTSYGRRSIAKRPTGTVVSLGRTRVIQNRMIKRLGLNKGEDGHFDLSPKTDANPDGTNYKMMAKLFQLNKFEASGSLTRAGFTEDQVIQIYNNLSTLYPAYIAPLGIKMKRSDTGVVLGPDLIVSKDGSGGATFGFN